MPKKKVKVKIEPKIEIKPTGAMTPEQAEGRLKHFQGLRKEAKTIFDIKQFDFWVEHYKKLVESLK